MIHATSFHFILPKIWNLIKMTTPFEAILTLAIDIQPIKNKYPMVVTYLKHLQNCSNLQSKNKEVRAFKSWLLENTSLPVITSPYYKSSKPNICFLNVYSIGNDATIKNFETNLMNIERLIFPDGRPVQEESATEANQMTPGAAAAMAAIESNPALSGLITSIKDVIANVDMSNDPSDIMENPKFKILLQNIQKGFANGNYKLEDITATIHSILGSVKDELDDNMASAMSEAVGMMTAAQRGQTPDINRIMDLLKVVSGNCK